MVVVVATPIVVPSAPTHLVRRGSPMIGVSDAKRLAGTVSRTLSANAQASDVRVPCKPNPAATASAASSAATPVTEHPT